MHMNRGASADSGLKDKGGTKKNVGGGVGLAEKEKMLKVSWEKVGEDYTAERLREILSRFGKIEDVVVKNSKKRGSALVVMGSKEAAVAAAGSLSGSLSNPLLVVPLQPTLAAEFSSAEKAEEDNCVNKLVGAGYQAYEDSVLKKLQMVAKKQK
ncbi:hypothetical protein SLEP1_g53422 [Rubroshorea leprosula]|uniref:RRM domain-containing protein n=1 Tax=Rubroshorea leprosula TaxID=152421 RepID=A0AAV5MAB5_9ROSI|nr:hypothetical protein SLEP1_g53422 [Rubroshorea leprosula]